MSEASPRFRQDLIVSPTEADGVACVDVSDPKTGTNFRLYDFEYQLALQLNGQPVAQVTDWASNDLRGGPDRRRDQRVRRAPRRTRVSRAEAARGAPAARDAPTTSGPEPRCPTTVDAGEHPERRPPRPPTATPPRRDQRRWKTMPPEAAAAEWESPQAAKTAQFVPDPAMLDSAPEPTPVVPLDVLKLAGGSPSAPEGAPTAIHAEVTAQAIAELPSEALDSEPVSAPPVERSRRAAAAKPDGRRQVELGDGSRRSAAVVRTRRPPSVRRPRPKDDALGPALPVQVVAPRRRPASPSAASRPSPRRW